MGATQSGPRPLLSLPGADARLLTDSTWTETDRGVPIYWFNGARVADDYADFYDGAWADEANPTNSFGNPRPLTGTAPWTGTDHDGTELFDGTASRAVGQAIVGAGVPGSTTGGAGPLNGGVTFASTGERPLYALWQVFVVDENFRLVTNHYEEREPGGIDGSDTRAAVRAQLFTTGSHSGGYGIEQIEILRGLDTDGFLGSVAIYTTDANGNADLADGLHATLSLESTSRDSWTLAAAAGTVLDPRTTYALVFLGDSGVYPELWTITADGESRPLEGWSIADALHYRDGTSWVEDPESRTLGMGIVGLLLEDTEGPALASATVAAAGNAVTLVFDEDVAVPPDPADAPTFLASLASAFAVTAGGDDDPVGGLSASSANPDQLTLGLSGVIAQGQAVTLTYTDPTAGDDAVALQDALGNETPTFTTGLNGVPAVINNSAINVPGAPTVLSATASGSARIDLSWSAPASTGGSAITGYRIEISSDGGSNWTDLVATTGATGTDYSDTSVPPGTTRHYRVSAINAGGTGVPSNTASATTVAATSVPGAPTGLLATASGSTGIDLSWSAPTGTGGSAITGYRIEVSSNGGSNWINLVANTSNTTTTYAHTGLAAGTTRHYRVSAINANGTGPTSGVANATTGTSVPGAPTVLSATASGTARIDLSWSAPASTGGTAITGYRIEVSPNGTSNWTDLVANTGNANTGYAHTGLAGGTTRHYRVSAINTNGAGATSGVDNATTLAVPGAPTGLSATASGSTGIDLSWSAPAGTGGTAITGYRIEVSPNGTSNWTDLVANTGNANTAYAHTGLTAGTTRHYRVSAINMIGTGATSNVDNATTLTVPGVPTRLTATAIGSTQINLTWSAPASDGGSAITGYKIEVSSDGGSNWSELVANTGNGNTTHFHTGLAASATRHYRVSAINANATGPSSGVANATTGASVPTQTSVGPGWKLTPEGLAAGDSFRLMFLSSTTRDAQPTDIATYNTWIQARAVAGHAAIRAHSSLFKVVGSTSAVHARDNTSTTYTSSAKGVAIYWLNGPQVADQYEDFYDGSWDNESDWTDETGTRRGGLIEVFTGSLGDGTEHQNSNSLGHAAFVATGGLNSTNHSPLTGNFRPVDELHRLYGLSPVFEVSDSTNSRAPAAVDDLAAVPVPRTTDSLTISWSAADNTGKPALTGYDVRYKEGFGEWTLVSQDAASTSVTIDGLSQDGYYLFEVRAVNAEYFGPWSSAEVLTSPLSEVVLANYPLVPDDLGPGDSFRLLSVTRTTTAATGTGIFDYLYFLGFDSEGLADSRNLLGPWGATQSGPRPLLSLPGADARLLTDSTWTETDRGVPIYWFNGARVADDYADFYDGAWADEANPTNSFGNPRPLTGTAPWTGTDHDGTELFDGTASRAVGQAIVGAGVPGSTTGGAGPLNGGVTFASTGERPLYALWQVFVVDENFRLVTNHYEEREPGGIDGSDTRAAVRAQLFTTGSHSGGYGIEQIEILRGLDTDGFLGSVAIYTTDANGNADLADGLHATLSLESTSRDSWTLAAAAGTVLDPRTTYALVFLGDSGVYPELWTITADGESRPLEGWSIADALHYRDGTSWVEDPESRTLGMGIVGLLLEDTEGPALASATVAAAGNAVTLVFDEDVAVPPDPADAPTFLASLASAFAVTAGGDDDPVGGLSASSANPDQLTLGLSGVIAQGQAVTLTYTDPTAGDDAVALQDALGNETPTFTTGLNGVPAVINNSAINVPGAPTVLSATASGSARIDLSWSAPASTGGSAITGYRIEISSDGGSNWTDLVATTGATGTDYSDTSVPPGTTRHYRVSAINAGGTGVPSNTASATTVAATSVPGAPTGLLATASGSTGIDLSWSAPTGTGGSAITGYRIEVSSNGGSNWINLVANTSNTTTTYAHTGLAAGDTRHYRVSAINANGTGPTSGVANATTNNPPAFSADTADRSVAENTAAGQNVGAALTATDADSDTLTYTLEGADAASFDLVSGSGQIRTKTGAIYNHEAKSTHTVIVKADDGNGGADAITVTITVTDVDEPPGIPAAPTVTATAGSNTSLDVSWTAPANTGPAIASYDLQYRQGDSGNFTDGPQDVTGTSAAIGSLAADTSYEVQVRATNAEGDGEWSLAGTGQTNNSAGAIEVPANWSLKPTGRAAGDQFRLLFLSSTKRNGSSTDIATYNTFVQERAAAGHADIRTYSAGFRAVGCTSDVDARDNTRTTGTGVPIYWLNGAKAADNYADFYDGSWDDEVNDKNESGTNGPDTSQSVNRPFTGCEHNGTEALDGSISQGFGAAGGTKVGRPNSSSALHGPLSSNAVTGTANTRPMYGLSAVFQVAAAVVVPNNPPAFSADTADRSVAENTAAGQNVGAALTATDADSDTLTYTLEGADAASFDLVSGSGQIRTKTGAIYNHEAKSTHTVIVKADDGNGGADAITVTITVTDVDEPPGIPAAPTVSATAGSNTSLDVSWTAPANTGPAIASYDLQYREGASGNFTDGPQDVTGASAAIGSLMASTSYQVQVRATNAEGDGDWSLSGTGQTGNSAPAFSADAADRSVPENTAAGQNVGAALTATDADSDTLTYTLEGADAASFDLVSGSGQIRTKTGVIYNHEAKSTHTVIVKADDGNGGADAITVTITVTDVDEPPGIPAAPTVTATAGSTTSLDVSWTAPANTGPAIASYDLQYREGDSGNFTNGPQDVTGASAAIGSLMASTSYQVQVRATNAEGDGDWSLSGTGQTGNSAPAFSADAADRSVPENTAAGQNVGAALTATDADSDTLTYTLEGADAASFDLVSGSGQIRTKTGVIYNHEAKSTHTVIVKADDGNGGADAITVTITVTDVDEPPGIPAAPTVTATAGSTTSLDVSWTAPANTGPAIASYDLQYREGDSGNFTNGPQDVTGASAAIGSLMASTSYQVQVRATNAEGDGDWSLSGTGQTGNSAPGAPTVLSATASGTTRIDLSWTAPASDGGSAITGYRIEVSSDGGSSWSDLVANTSNTTSTYSHTGLTAGDTRHYRVSAINANGAGTASNVANATTGQTTVTFGAASYTAAEGGAAATVAVQMSAAPSASVTIPLTKTHRGGATAADYSGVPSNVTFTAGQTRRTFTVTATDDPDKDGGESVQLGFGTLPGGYAPGARRTATVTLVDDDANLIVNFGTERHTTVKVRESDTVWHRFIFMLTTRPDAPPNGNPQQPVTIPLVVTHRGRRGFADDYTPIPSSVTFGVGESVTFFRMRAIPDRKKETGEGLRLDFGPLPAGVRAGTWGPYETIEFLDEYLPDLTVRFGASSYTAAEGGADARVSIHLSEKVDVEPLVVRLSAQPGGGATPGDYSVPSSVTFAVGEQTKTIAVAAVDDTDDDDGESVTLSFVNAPNDRLITDNRPSTATVALEDNDGAGKVEVSFGAATYTATEGGSGATVRVQLDAAPGRAVTVPLTAAGAGGATAGGLLRHSGERDVRGQPDVDDVDRDRDRRHGPRRRREREDRVRRAAAGRVGGPPGGDGGDAEGRHRAGACGAIRHALGLRRRGARGRCAPSVEAAPEQEHDAAVDDSAGGDAPGRGDGGGLCGAGAERDDPGGRQGGALLRARAAGRGGRNRRRPADRLRPAAAGRDQGRMGAVRNDRFRGRGSDAVEPAGVGVVADAGLSRGARWRLDAVGRRLRGAGRTAGRRGGGAGDVGVGGGRVGPAEAGAPGDGGRNGDADLSDGRDAPDPRRGGRGGGAAGGRAGPQRDRRVRLPGRTGACGRDRDPGAAGGCAGGGASGRRDGASGPVVAEPDRRLGAGGAERRARTGPARQRDRGPEPAGGSDGASGAEPGRQPDRGTLAALGPDGA